jgi:hypothetical protein
MLAITYGPPITPAGGCQIRVARWYAFKPKIQIQIIFGRALELKKLVHCMVI